MKNLLLLLLLFPMGLFAQEIAPQSVNSTGGKMTQSNGSLSFTVGELVVLSFEDAMETHLMVVSHLEQQ